MVKTSEKIPEVYDHLELKKVKDTDGRIMSLTPEVYKYFRGERDIIKGTLTDDHLQEKFLFYWKLAKVETGPDAKTSRVILVPEELESPYKMIQIKLSKKQFEETGVCSSTKIMFKTGDTQVTIFPKRDHIWMFVDGPVSLGTTHNVSGWSLFLHDFKKFYGVGKTKSGGSKKSSGAKASNTKKSSGSKPKAKGKAKGKAKSKSKAKGKGKAKK